MLWFSLFSVLSDSFENGWERLFCLILLRMAGSFENVWLFWKCLILLRMSYYFENVLFFWECLILLRMSYYFENVLLFWECLILLRMCDSFENVWFFWEWLREMPCDPIWQDEIPLRGSSANNRARVVCNCPALTDTHIAGANILITGKSTLGNFWRSFKRDTPHQRFCEGKLVQPSWCCGNVSSCTKIIDNIQEGHLDQWLQLPQWVWAVCSHPWISNGLPLLWDIIITIVAIVIIVVIITIVAIIIDTITIAFFSPGRLRWQTFPIFI